MSSTSHARCPLSPMLYHRAGYDGTHKYCRADDHDSNCVQRPPDERKFMRNGVGSVMGHTIWTMKRHGNQLQLIIRRIALDVR